MSMKINFKSPRYVIPLIALPFFCLFFYIYQSSLVQKISTGENGSDSLQVTISGVSEKVKNRSLIDKLEAYRKLYRKGDGYTAIRQIQEEPSVSSQPESQYNVQEKRLLDSIEQALTGKGYAEEANAQRNYREEDRALAEALSALHQPSVPEKPQEEQADPMELFRKQMVLVDSMSKANDPAYQAELRRKKQKEEAGRRAENAVALPVVKSNAAAFAFNTVLPENQERLIQAIVDERITGYAGSRLRIRLLDDIMAGGNLIRKGTYLYAEISGFSAQRVKLTISSIMYKGEVLPVRLEVYDHDGLPGLYVPASAFREFSRELGGSASQGLTLQQQAENNSQLVMSLLQRMFQSTTTAVTRQIRKNKAKIKYNTLVYLIDGHELRKNSNRY